MFGCSSGLRRAMRANDLEAIRRILEDAGDSASDVINEDTSADCCLDWLEACCHGNRPPLHTAVAKHNVAMATILLDYGADVTSQNRNGDTALHLAANVNHRELCELLVSRGVSVMAPNGRGQSAGYASITSITAVAREDVTTTQFFLQHAQFDVHQADADGNTLLHAACACDNVTAVKVLLGVGIDQTRTNRYGKTAAQVARAKVRAILNS